MTTLVIIAKQPIPGMAKTRLHPPLSLEQAAQLAAASLDDTFTAVSTLPATRRVLAFDGGRAPAASAGYDIVPQVAGGLDARIAAIFDGCTEPAAAGIPGGLSYCMNLGLKFFVVLGFAANGGT